MFIDEEKEKRKGEKCLANRVYRFLQIINLRWIGFTHSLNQQNVFTIISIQPREWLSIFLWITSFYCILGFLVYIFIFIFIIIQKTSKKNFILGYLFSSLNSMHTRFICFCVFLWEYQNSVKSLLNVLNFCKFQLCWSFKKCSL